MPILGLAWQYEYAECHGLIVRFGGVCILHVMVRDVMVSMVRSNGNGRYRPRP